MAGDTDGLAGALAKAVADAPSPIEAEAEQLTFLAQEPILGEIAIEGKGVVNRGRPPGARNKRTEDLAAFILSRHRHPIIAAAEIVDTPIPTLAKALKCKLLDAAEFQRKCMEFVARYTLQAMPQAVKLDGVTAGQIMVINLNAARPGEASTLSPHGLDLTLEQNQGLSEPAAEASHGEPSHGGDK